MLCVFNEKGISKRSVKRIAFYSLSGSRVVRAGFAPFVILQFPSLTAHCKMPNPHPGC